jgi:hypothetical protein
VLPTTLSPHGSLQPRKKNLHATTECFVACLQPNPACEEIPGTTWAMLPFCS